MTTQIAVRLQDELVEYVDTLVASGRASSRAAAVAAALERDRRRSIALRDAEILAREGGYPGLDGLAEHVASQPIGLD